MFNNLLYIFIVLVALEMKAPPFSPGLAWVPTISIFLLKLAAFCLSIRTYLVARKIKASADYFRAVNNLSMLAVLVFLVDIYLLDLHYYLGLLPFFNNVPLLTSLIGIVLFYSYLALVWLLLRRDYEHIFMVSRPTGIFIFEQFKNSALVLVPWLLLSFLNAILLMVPIPAWQMFLAGDWGEPVILVCFLLTLPVWLPGLLVRMMGCRPLPLGEKRQQIEAFCSQQQVAFGEIYSWPLFGGKILSAGVVGFVGKFRYLLLTPALLDIAKEDELEAVLAHEIGHVKKHHLLLYLLLLVAFGITLQFALEPLLQSFMGSQFILPLLFNFEGNPSTLAPLLVGAPLLLATVLYVRFIFGFFMRNFERQADLYSYHVMGGAKPLVSILEKIAWLGGNIRDQPSWHHFGISRRTDFLKDCEEGKRNPSWHEFKVYSILFGFFLVVTVGIVIIWHLDSYVDLTTRPGAEFAKGFIARKVETEPNNPLWLHLSGDMLAGQKRYAEAVAAYEKSLSFQPNNPEVLNNLAWLYLTAEKKAWRNPGRALDLARRAAAINARSHILDTLAEAQWQNGESVQAVETERQALESARGNREYYRAQLEKFQAGPTSS